MKVIIGLVLLVLSVIIGLWLGVWVMFIGGIVQIINAVQVHPVHAVDIAIGLFRIFGAGIVGFFSFMVLFAAGLGFLDSGVKSKSI